MKTFISIFLCHIFFVANIFAKDMIFYKDDSNYRINSEIQNSLIFKSNLEYLLKVLNTKNSDFNFLKNLKQFVASTTKVQDLKLDPLFFDRDYLLGRSVDVKNAMISLEKKIKEYKEMQKKIQSEKIEHYYIDRMNCTESTSSCYNLKFSDYTISACNVGPHIGHQFKTC